jgi:predicted kinase
MQLVIFVGLQASGKSSFYRERFRARHVHVSKDLFRNNKNPGRRQRVLITEALGRGESVVVDNTNPTPGDRIPLIELGRSLGAEVIGYYFESKLADCLERNLLREGKARVPEVALRVTVRKLQRPTYQEGYQRLYHVRMGEEGWVVSDWIEEETPETEGTTDERG